jgi:hypothetical protein
VLDGRQERHTEFWCGDLIENVHLEEDGRITLRWVLGRYLMGIEGE